MLNIVPVHPSNKYREITNSGSIFTSISFWSSPIMLIIMIIVIISIAIAFTTSKSDVSLASVSASPSKDTGTPKNTNEI